MPSSLADLAERFRITNGKKFRLKDVNPGDTGKLKSPEKATELLRESVRLMSEFQEKLYAQDRWALLLVFQAMDAAGKDGTIKHVMSGVNPQGCEVSSFKARAIWSWITIFSGVRRRRYRSAGGSGFSTAPTTRMCSWCACIRNFSRAENCRRS